MSGRRWPWSRKSAEAAPTWAPDAWPGDAATLERWLRTELLAELNGGSDASGAMLQGLEYIRITADLVGSDITHLLVDGTDVDLTVRAPDEAASATPTAEKPEREITTRTPGRLRSARLTAQPVFLQGYPIRADVTVADVPFDWVQYAEPEAPERPSSAFGFEPSDADARPSGTFAFSIRADDVAPLIADIATPMLASVGVKLRRLDCTISATRRGLVTVSGSGAIRWKIFGASVHATVSVLITSDAVVTLKKLRMHSFNPFVAGALVMARSELKAMEGQVVDLNESLAEGGGWAPRLHDLRITIGDEIGLSGRFR